LTFNNSSTYRADTIEKMLEITTFVIKFFKEESVDESAMDLGDKEEVKEKVERLLLMNLNQNF
jgi:hypothetical protein